MSVRPLLVPQDRAALSANNFDALRLFLALLVVWSHCFAMWYGTEAGEPLSRLLGGVYNAGSLAVLGFFAISGFLITLSYAQSSNPRRFLVRRVRRILPGYFVAVTLCSLLVVPAFASAGSVFSTRDVWAGLASNLLLRNYIIPSDAFGGAAINGALWSIAYEFWCYVGVLALGLAGFIHRRPIWPALATATLAGRLVLDLIHWQPGGAALGRIVGAPMLWFYVLPSFLLGATVYQYRKIIPRNGCLAAALVLATIASTHLPEPTHVTQLLVPPTLTYLIFYLAFAPWLRLHSAARLGDFSYGIYLYSFPIQRMLQWTLHDRVSFPAYILLSIAGAFAAAIASWHLVERWFLGPVRRRAAGRPLADEATIAAP